MGLINWIKDIFAPQKKTMPIFQRQMQERARRVREKEKKRPIRGTLVEQGERLVARIQAMKKEIQASQKNFWEIKNDILTSILPQCRRFLSAANKHSFQRKSTHIIIDTQKGIKTIDSWDIKLTKISSTAPKRLHKEAKRSLSSIEAVIALVVRDLKRSEWYVDPKQKVA